MANIRPIQESEYKFLDDFLYHSIFVPSGYGTLSREVIYKPEIFVYIEDFGQHDDIGLQHNHVDPNVAETQNVASLRRRWLAV
jgi:hypothetical protein